MANELRTPGRREKVDDRRSLAIDRVGMKCKIDAGRCGSRPAALASRCVRQYGPKPFPGRYRDHQLNLIPPRPA
jgi:hypothetical protein